MSTDSTYLKVRIAIAWIILYPFIAIFILIMLLIHIKDAHAGVNGTSLSKVINIVNLDEKKRAEDALNQAKKDADRASSAMYISNSLHRWHLKNLLKSLENESDREKELMILSAVNNIYKQKSDFVAKVFPDDTLGVFLAPATAGETTYEEYRKSALAYHLENFDREVGDLKDDYDIIDMRNAILTDDKSYLKEIIKIIHESQKASEDAFGAQKIREVRSLLNQGRIEEARAEVNKALKVYASSPLGASVYCGSEVVR